MKKVSHNLCEIYTCIVDELFYDALITSRSLDETTFECQSFVLMIPSVSLYDFYKSWSSVFRVSKCLQVCKFLIRAEMPWNDTDNLIITYFALLYCVTITFTDQFLMFQPCHSSLSMSPLCTSPPPPPAPPCRPSRRTPPLSELISRGKLLNPSVPNNNDVTFTGENRKIQSLLPVVQKTEKLDLWTEALTAPTEALTPCQGMTPRISVNLSK